MGSSTVKVRFCGMPSELARSMSPEDKPQKRTFTVELPMNPFGHGGGPEQFERKEPNGSNWASQLGSEFEEGMLKVGISGAVSSSIVRQPELLDDSPADWR